MAHFFLVPGLHPVCFGSSHNLTTVSLVQSDSHGNPSAALHPLFFGFAFLLQNPAAPLLGAPSVAGTTNFTGYDDGWVQL